MAITLLLILMRKVHLLPPSIKDLQIFRFLKNGKAMLRLHILNIIGVKKKKQTLRKKYIEIKQKTV